jgi:hypothetical protein
VTTDEQGAVAAGPHRRTTLTPTATLRVPGPVRRARGFLVFTEVSNAPCQDGLLERWEVNLPNFPNFRGMRNSGKFDPSPVTRPRTDSRTPSRGTIIPS